MDKLRIWLWDIIGRHIQYFSGFETEKGNKKGKKKAEIENFLWTTGPLVYFQGMSCVYSYAEMSKLTYVWKKYLFFNLSVAFMCLYELTSSVRNRKTESTHL